MISHTSLQTSWLLICECGGHSYPYSQVWHARSSSPSGFTDPASFAVISSSGDVVPLLPSVADSVLPAYLCFVGPSVVASSGRRCSCPEAGGCGGLGRMSCWEGDLAFLRLPPRSMPCPSWAQDAGLCVTGLPWQLLSCWLRRWETQRKYWSIGGPSHRPPSVILGLVAVVFSYLTSELLAGPSAPVATSLPGFW